MMTLIRRAEEIIAGLVEAGEARCPCHLYIGQEAVAAGVAAALTAGDTVWGGHRSHGHYLAQGASAEALFAEVLGKTTGCSGGRGGSMHLWDAPRGILGTVPIVAATVPLAAGAALAAKLRGEAHTAVAYFGDGTLEEGHVHETLNLAALYRLPLVFVVENNLYASHMHWSERRMADHLHRAGEFAGVPGERVDGNDVREVFSAAARAVSRARTGGGPTLIECRTFRWRGHVGASTDIDVGVRRRGELAEWLDRDPIRRVAAQIQVQVDLGPLSQAIEDELAAALAAARGAPAPGPARLLDHVFEPSAQEALAPGASTREATAREATAREATAREATA